MARADRTMRARSGAAAPGVESACHAIVPTSSTSASLPHLSARQHGRAWFAALGLAVLATGCAVTPPPASTSAEGPVAVASTTATTPAPVPAPAASAAATPQDAASAPENTASTTPPEAADPLRPEKRVDFDDPKARADLWSRRRAGYSMPTM